MIIIIFIILIWLTIFFVIKLWESIINLWLVTKHRKDIPLHEGIVYNIKSKKLEDSNSPILPY